MRFNLRRESDQKGKVAGIGEKQKNQDKNVAIILVPRTINFMNNLNPTKPLLSGGVYRNHKTAPV